MSPHLNHKGHTYVSRKKIPIISPLTFSPSKFTNAELSVAINKPWVKVQKLISILCNHREFYNRGCSRMVSDFVQTY